MAEFFHYEQKMPLHSICVGVSLNFESSQFKKYNSFSFSR